MRDRDEGQDGLGGGDGILAREPVLLLAQRRRHGAMKKLAWPARATVACRNLQTDATVHTSPEMA